MLIQTYEKIRVDEFIEICHRYHHNHCFVGKNILFFSFNNTIK